MSARSGTPESLTSLNGRLIIYTAAGVGLLLSGGAAEAQTILYSDPSDIVLHADENNETSGALIDLNGDAVNDFGASAGKTSITISDRTFTRTQTVVDGLGTSRFVLSDAPPFAAALSSGQAIGPSANFSPTAQTPLQMQAKAKGVGGWPSGVDHYVGVEFKIGAATHYGWVRAVSEANGDFAQLVIKDWAYNTTADEGIVAGELRAASAVPEPSSLALFAAGGAAALGLLRRRRSTSWAQSDPSRHLIGVSR